MEFVLIWFASAVLCAIAAGSRGRSGGGWFLLGLIFGFFALIAVLVMPKYEEGANAGSEGANGRWVCERCRAYIAPNSVFCPSCGETPKPPVLPTAEKTCSACFAKIDARATRCRFCTAEQPSPIGVCPSCGAALGANTRSCPKCETAIGV